MLASPQTGAGNLPARSNLSMLWTVAVLVALVNIPFGYWREGVRKFSPAWFVAVHAPVPIAIGLRFASGLGFRWATLPLFVVAFFGGQWLGGKLRAQRASRRKGPAGPEAPPPAHESTSDSPV